MFGDVFLNSTFSGSQTCNTWAGATLLAKHSMTTVTGCTFVYNDSQRDGVGMMATTISGSIDISGNTFEHNNAYGIFDDEPDDGIGAGVELFNNDFSVLDIQVGDNLTQGDNLDIDPQLAVDFHLLSYSPVIDMGTNAPGLPDEDFEGDGCGGCSIRAGGSGSAFAQFFAILGLLLVVLRRRRF